MSTKETPVFDPQSLDDWRHWLEANHLKEESVWLVFYNKASGKSVITWSESVDMALCFGWIDSKKIKIDADTSHQFFSKRKAQSTWSRINKQKVDQLIAAGLMAEAGFKSIEIAKQNGSWTILDDVEDLIIPPDLQYEFEKHVGALDFFLGLGKSHKKQILYWVVSAKRSETREKRIAEIAFEAGRGKKPGHIV